MGNQTCLGKSSHKFCPVKTLVQYLIVQGSTPGPLFLLPNKKALKRVYFSKILHNVFEELSMSPHQFNTRSFQIGVSTTAKQAGVSDSHLRTLGRWRSDAYLKYVQLIPQDLARLSKVTRFSLLKEKACHFSFLMDHQ